MLGEFNDFPLLILQEEQGTDTPGTDPGDSALSGAVLSLAVTALCALVAMLG